MSQPFIGQVKMVGFNFAPVNWAFCDGQLLSIAENDTLFALIGTTYGGDGQTTFALPNLRSRMPIHQGQGPGSSNHALGQAAGTENVTLVSPQMPQHTHTLTQTVTKRCQNGPGNSKSPVGNFFASGTSSENFSTTGPAAMSELSFTTTVGMAGGNQPHDNMSPYTCVNFIISLYGVFPSRN
jgi:microcystin-dependent protein